MKANSTLPRVNSDATLNRVIIALVALIAIGVPAIAITYWADRHVDGGSSIVDRTIARAEEEVRADPNRLSSRLTLAAAYGAAGRARDAIVQYDEVLNAQPANRIALLGRADAQREVGDLDAAAVDYQALVDVARDGEMAGADPQLEAAYYGLGAVALAQGRPSDAATNLANALLIDGTDADALDLIGQALVAIGDYENAVSALRDAVALVPTGWSEPYEHMGQAYDGLGDADGAAYATGMIALCEHRLSDAEEALSPLATGSHARDALVGLGLIAEERGDVAGAEGLYRQILAADPNDFAALSGLGRVVEPAPADTAAPVLTPGEGE